MAALYMEKGTYHNPILVCIYKGRINCLHGEHSLFINVNGIKVFLNATIYIYAQDGLVVSDMNTHVRM